MDTPPYNLIVINVLETQRQVKVPIGIKEICQGKKVRLQFDLQHSQNFRIFFLPGFHIPITYHVNWINPFKKGKWNNG